MSRHGYEHMELIQEINDSNIAQLLELFKRESGKYSAKCVEYIDLDNKLSEEGEKRVEEECKHLGESRNIIAIELAERMISVE